MPGQNQILLQMKPHRPRLPKDLVERLRLMEWLNDGINHQLILVCAPAGFGKTTLKGTWLECLSARQSERADSFPSAWLSLDENDNDLILFLSYSITALRTIFYEACEATLALTLPFVLVASILLLLVLLPIAKRLGANAPESIIQVFSGSGRA